LKASKVFGLVIGVMQLASVIGLVLGMHTILGVFTSAMPNENQEIEISPNGPLVIPFSLTPTNTGYLDASFEIHMSVVADGVTIATDSASVEVPPGSTVPVDLTLTISEEDVMSHLQEVTSVQWVIDVQTSTLYDLLSFSNHIVIEGGSNGGQ